MSAGAISYLDVLRQLADRQQFELLRGNAEALWAESGAAASLPLLALACAHLGDRAGAEGALAQLAPYQAQLDVDARVDLAAAHILTGRQPGATTALEVALNALPGHALALARLAFCRMQAGLLDEACQLYQRSTEIAPHRLPVWSALARLHLQAGDLDSAQTALDAAQARLREQVAALPTQAFAQFSTQLNGVQLEIWVAANRLAECEAWLEARRTALPRVAEEAEKTAGQPAAEPDADWVSYVIGYAHALAGRDRHAEAEMVLSDALKHSPENLALIGHLAELAQVQGRTMQAIQILRQAIRLAKRKDEPVARRISLLTRLTDATLRGFGHQARQAADEAMQLAEGLVATNDLPEAQIRALRGQAWNALAQVESDEQHFETAESLYNEILANNPWHLPALQGLGQQQMQRGRIGEAVALFERIHEIDPANGLSWLINVRKVPEDSESLERMEKLARQPSLEGSARSGLLFQLAAAWEKKRDYTRAIRFAHEANAASRKHLRYDPKAHSQQCARIRHAFCKELYARRQDCGHRGEDESLPVFVLGMPRSGTTLVEQILAGHSQIFGAGELGIIPSRIHGVNRWERHVGSGREYPDCVDDLNPYTTRGIAEGILKELKELAAEAKPAARFIIDKLPHNFENVGLIKFLFPKAKIISVRRDPRDIAISNYFTDYAAKHGGMGFAYDLTWIGEQLADHALLMHHWNQLFPDELLEVKYEDVVEDTELQARRMLEYLGVEWEPQVLAFNELDRPVKTASVWQVRQPIYKTSKAKWERYQDHLAPLIAGTNAKITWDPIEMERFPTPGIFTDGVALYKADKLDEAEYAFKKVLHHFPEHAAANFMVGLIYVRKGHLPDAIPLMEKALAICPWHADWRRDLIQACEMAGQKGKAEALKNKSPLGGLADEIPRLREDKEIDAYTWPSTRGVTKGVAA